MSRENPETSVVRATRELLELAGYPAWRVNARVVDMPTAGGTRPMWTAPKGWPDLVAIGPGGRFVAIECKVGKRVLEYEQASMLRTMRDAGALVYVVRDNPAGLIEAIREGVSGADLRRHKPKKPSARARRQDKAATLFGGGR